MFKHAANCETKLRTMYSEPHRYYHTMKHINDMLGMLKKYKKNIEHYNSVELAIWYHDCIYDPTNQDSKLNNEMMSADILSDDWLGLLEFDDFQSARSMVLATINHKRIQQEDFYPYTHPDFDWFLDFDMAALGYNYATFKQNNKNIRKEFSHLSYEDYRVGNDTFLGNLLETDIFATDTFKDMYESKAKFNIKKWINRK